MAKNAKFWHILTESGLESRGGWSIMSNTPLIFPNVGHYVVGHYWTLLDIIGQNWTFIPGFTEMVAKTVVYHF